jgi:flagellar assembly protein FliH
MARVIKSVMKKSATILEYKRSSLREIEGTGALEMDIVDPAAILAEARAEAELKVREAYEEGMRRGEEAGRKSFEESVGQSAAMLDAIATQLQENREQFTQTLTNEISELVRIVAGKVLAIEVTTQPEVIQLMVCRTLEKLMDQDRVLVRVNPNDYAQVIESKKSLLERFDRIEHMEVIQDGTIETGGCIAESDRLYVDAQLQSQLKEIIDGMNEVND